MTQLFANLLVERTPRGTNENTEQLQEPKVSPSQGLNLPPCASNTFKLSKNLILNLAGSTLLINDEERESLWTLLHPHTSEVARSRTTMLRILSSDRSFTIGL
jgi:hypothetical protein